VDPQQRRIEVAEAVWRVVRRDGLDRASVRAVAREAGLSMGSLRHYFATQSELRIFAMGLVVERIDLRLRALQLPTDPRQAAVAELAELLPLDADRQAENEVWLAFVAKALVDPALRHLRDEGYEQLRSICHRCVIRLIPAGRSTPDIEFETDRLFAVLDGLAVHAAMRPAHASADRLLGVLTGHLNQLSAP
jgi:AcrR family transcriptional regulator